MYQGRASGIGYNERMLGIVDERCTSLKWPGKGCALGEDVNGVGDYHPGASARSLP